jgi:hypothetical protein
MRVGSGRGILVAAVTAAALGVLGGPTNAAANATPSPTAAHAGSPGTARTALAGSLARGIIGRSACPSYAYGSTIIPGSQWAGGLGNPVAPDGATFDVKSNWNGSSCVRGPSGSDTSDRWGLDYQCTQLAVRAADLQWGEGDNGTWAAAGWNGNAYNMFDVGPNLPTPLVAVGNGSGLLPNPGDLLVWGATSGDLTGHVAVVERVDTSAQMVWFVSQNSYYAEYGLPYTGTTLDPTGSFGLPLRGWLDDPRPARGVAVRTDGASGYTLDGWGGVHPFGGAPPVTIGAYWPNWDIARAIALGPDGKSGYTLDGWGGVHPFGNALPIAVSAFWPGWDIARALVVRADGASGYVLDGWGGLHPFGGAPAVTTSAYWRGWDIARSVVLRPDGVSGYVLDGFGGMHPFGGAPGVTTSAYWLGWDIARSITLAGDGTNPLFPLNSGWVLDGWGGVHPFGGAPYVSFAVSPFYPGHDTAKGIAYSALFNHGVTVSGTSAPVPFSVGGAAHGLVLRADGTSGYLLDGWGTLTPFGGAPPLTNVSGVWPQWDIARAVALRSDGISGYVADAWGGLHPFGGAPPIAAPNYWIGQDMVRGLVLRADGVSGYVVDAFGNLWGFGNAPAVVASKTWQTDSVRGLALRSDGASGYVLDEFGSVWPFGGAPAVGGPPPWAQDTARGLALLTDISGYVLDREGGIHPFGGAQAVSGAPVWTGNDVARGIALARGSNTTHASGSIVFLDGVVNSFSG